MRYKLFTLTLLLLTSIPLAAQSTVRCESDGRYRECTLDGPGTATLVRQLSSASCVENETWGYRGNHVWVDRGCRADFAMQRAYGGYNGGGTTIVCESTNNGRTNCPADTRNGVQFSRQLSKSSCIEGQSWGYTRGTVWVDRGCRAEFIIGGTSSGFRRGQGRLDQSVICESTNGRRQQCAAYTGSGVELRRQISKNSCEFGRDWGYDRNNIWVTNGCRAEFAVSSFRSGNGGYGNGTSQNDTVGPLVRCDSTNNNRTYCRADTRYGVQLYRQISDSDCVRNRTWGYDNNGIWVSGGCRAEFELNTH